MTKIFTFFLFILLTNASLGQCPSITDAMINSCGTSEGNNEFVVFKTTADATAGSYVLNYGSNVIPTTNPTGVLSGTNASPKTGTGTVMVSSACVVHEITSPATVIPAGSKVIFIPAVYDQNYDITGVCDGTDIYVVYIDIATLPSKWSGNGNFANSPSGARYLQISNDGSACEDSVRSFENNWAGNGDGNFVSWNNGSTVYTNNGCTTIVTPIKLISFSAALSGSNANLSWKTTNELNAKGFDIQWSADGINFTSIGIIGAAGNSTSIKKYATVHYGIPAGANFYRLKTIDIDGSFSYSQIIKLLNYKGNAGIRVHAFPGGKVNIDWNTDHKGKTVAMVFDYAGRKLIEKQLVSVAGANHCELEAGKLPSGGYVIKLVNDAETIVTRFAK